MLVSATALAMSLVQPSYSVPPFYQDKSQMFGLKEGLPDEQVYALAITGETLWAGTGKGLARASLNALAQGNPWQVVLDQPVRFLATDSTAEATSQSPLLYAANERTLWQVSPEGRAQKVYEAEMPLIQILPAQRGGLWLLSESTLLHWEETIRARYAPPEGRRFRWMVEDTRGRLFAFAEGELERALYRLMAPSAGERDKPIWQKVGIKDNRGRYYDDLWLCAISDSLGHLWVGARSGLILGDGEGWWLSREAVIASASTVPPTAELVPPYGNIRCLAFAPNGDLWAGTPEGACRLRDGKWSYFWGRRWLPGNRVNAIALDAQNRAWIATDKGIACIESVRMTLREKAEHYEALIALRHNRHGFVTNCDWDDPNDPDGWKIEASDNDGLWTALYCAAQCFQYATTKEAAARERARRSMRALLDLERLTGIPGFPARSIIRKDETRYYQSTGEWHESPVDPNYIWKGDTSSDELDGHYFIWAIYYDLVADEAEKEAIRGVVRRVTDHLMQNNWRLIDKDGKPTRWAIFNPESLNDDPIWEEERGLNALSILSHLKVAYHITGDPKYQQAYEELIKKHHYLLNAVTQKMLPPYYVNHSDDQLAFLCYYPLLLYEKNPEYRRLWLMSLERSWQIERAERSPLFNFIYGAVTGKPCDVEAAVRTLQEWPLDQRNWECRNSHRLDITLDASKGRFGEAQSVEVLPYSERTLMRWNGNPYRLDGGDPLGRREEDGVAFLLPYWMGRYHGLIVE
jgi:hypothetical protein